MSRANRFNLATAALIGAGLAGCVEYYAGVHGAVSSAPATLLPAGSATGTGAYPSYPTAGGTRYGEGYGGQPAYQPPRTDSGLSDWRDGDAEYRRRQEDRLGTTPLEERTRLHRQERLEEATEQRIDDAIRRRETSPGGVTGEIGTPVEPVIREGSDAAANRRLERSTQAERQKQRDAAEVRRQLLETQGGGGSLIEPTAPGSAPVPNE